MFPVENQQEIQCPDHLGAWIIIPPGDREQHVEFLAEGQQSYQDAFLDDESELDGLGFLEQRCHQVRRYYR